MDADLFIGVKMIEDLSCISGAKSRFYVPFHTNQSFSMYLDGICLGQVFRLFYVRFLADQNSNYIYTDLFFCGSSGSKVSFNDQVELITVSAATNKLTGQFHSDLDFYAKEQVSYTLKCTLLCPNFTQYFEVQTTNRTIEFFKAMEFLPGDVVTLQASRCCVNRVAAVSSTADQVNGGSTVTPVIIPESGVDFNYTIQVQTGQRLMAPLLVFDVVGIIPPDYESYQIVLHQTTSLTRSTDSDEALLFSLQYLETQVEMLNSTDCKAESSFSRTPPFSSPTLVVWSTEQNIVCYNVSWEDCISSYGLTGKDKLGYLPVEMAFATNLCFRITYASYDTRRPNIEQLCNNCTSLTTNNLHACFVCQWGSRSSQFVTPTPQIYDLHCNSSVFEEHIIRVSFIMDYYVESIMEVQYSLVQSEPPQASVFVDVSRFHIQGGCQNATLKEGEKCKEPWRFQKNMTLTSDRKQIMPNVNYYLEINLTVASHYTYQSPSPLTCASYVSPSTLMINFICILTTPLDNIFGNFTVVLFWQNFDQFEGEIRSIEILFNSQTQVEMKNNSIALAQERGVDNKQTSYGFIKPDFPDLYYGSSFKFYIEGITKNGEGGFVGTECYQPVRRPPLNPDLNIKSELVSSTQTSIKINVYCRIFVEVFDLIQHFRFYISDKESTTIPPESVQQQICTRNQSITFMNYGKVDKEATGYYTGDFNKNPSCYEDTYLRVPLKSLGDTFSVTIGSDEYSLCEKNQASNKSCNGPLMPKKIYTMYLVAVAHDYTSDLDACTLTYLGQYETVGLLEQTEPAFTVLTAFVILQIATCIIGVAIFFAFRDNYKKNMYFTLKHRAIAVHRSKDPVFDWRNPIWHKTFAPTLFGLSANYFILLEAEFKRFDEDEFPFMPTVTAYDHRLNVKNDQHPLPKKFHVLPYETTISRIQCDHSEDPKAHLMGGYYNASYIRGASNRNKFKYIAAVHPKSNTLKHFWRLIVDSKVPAVIMLEDYQKNGKTMCAEYLPADETTPLHIHSYILHQKGAVDSTTKFYNERTIQILNRQNMEKRIILVVNYHSFPADGDLTRVSQVLDFLFVMRKVIKTVPGKNATDVLVHCPNGSRSCGMYIASDRLIQEAVEKNYSDVMGCVADLKTCRKNMVPILHQYLFLYHLVLLFLSKFKKSTVGRRNMASLWTGGDQLRADHELDQLDDESAGGYDESADGSLDEFDKAAAAEQENEADEVTVKTQSSKSRSLSKSSSKRRRHRRRQRRPILLHPVIEESDEQFTETLLSVQRERSERDSGDGESVLDQDKAASEHEEDEIQNEPFVQAQPSFEPRPLHVAASNLIGRQFRPNDFSRARQLRRSQQRQSLATNAGARKEFNPKSFRQNARQFFDASGGRPNRRSTVRIRNSSPAVFASTARSSESSGPSSSNRTGREVPDSEVNRQQRLPRTAAERRAQRQNRKTSQRNNFFNEDFDDEMF